MAAVALFAGIRVRDLAAARPWYERLLGQPSFFPNATEVVWTLADDRSVYLEQDRRRAGGALITVLVDDLDACVAEIGARGLEPAERRTSQRRAQGDVPRRTTATRSASGTCPGTPERGAGLRADRELVAAAEPGAEDARGRHRRRQAAAVRRAEVLRGRPERRVDVVVDPGRGELAARPRT